MMNLYRQLNNVSRSGVRNVGSIIKRERVEPISVSNEKVLSYMPGSPERENLLKAIQRMSQEVEEVPLIIGNEEIKSDLVKFQPMPHNHKKKIAKYYWATKEHLEKAMKVASKAMYEWDRRPVGERIDIWMRAADLMAGKYRQDLNAATMLGQSKTIIQAEIDSAAELIDFFRFNAANLSKATQYQPISENPSQVLNSMRYRGLEGFVAAVSPFNFTAIGGNLAYTPALAGCSVLWKPSDTALLSNWVIFKICREAGVPPGVVNFVPADGPTFGDAVTSNKNLACINFTGSVPTFNRLWTQVGNNINTYKSYPRLIGECGGKNFHLVHPTADVTNVVFSTIRSSFEYCGQKCSACSRMYVPESLWPKIREGLVEEAKKLKIADPTEADTFMGAVIDERAFNRISGYIEYGKKNGKIVVGGDFDNSVGYFIQPTIIQVNNPTDKLMTEEIFGPLLSVYVYKDKDINDILDLTANSTAFALTGAVFAQDEAFLRYAEDFLRESIGNFYVNDKSTGSIVGQQPFGGARMSGTNDKAGGPHYVLRYTSPQAIKENFVINTEWKYPYMGI